MNSRLLPEDVPNNKLNDYDYEQGFEEELLVNPEYADCFSCPICHGIPRNPVIIKPCDHFLLRVLRRETRGFGNSSIS